MKIKNKKTGYVFEISDIEGKRLITDNSEEFEPLDKRLLPKKSKPKTIKEKVVAIEPLNVLKKEQIIQELEILKIPFNPKSKKKELIEILKSAGGI